MRDGRDMGLEPLLDRRRFLVVTSSALVPASAWAQAPADHQIKLDIPLLSEDATGVPVAFSVDHPMEADHYIRSVEVTLAADPIPSKGTYLFTPTNGRAAAAFKMRSGAGGRVQAVAECTKHGKFSATRDIRVAEGGCAMPPDGGSHVGPKNVQIRLPQSLRIGEVVDVRVRVDHDTETGLAFRGGKYVREAPEFFLKDMVVFLDDQKISEFRLSSAISANPIIRFPIRVPRSGTLKVVFVNSQGQRAEASQPVKA
jgi:sulfur-oxidizing protein SoxY